MIYIYIYYRLYLHIMSCQMLHGAGIVSNICPNKKSSFVGKYQHHGAYELGIDKTWPLDLFFFPCLWIDVRAQMIVSTMHTMFVAF